MRNVIIIGATLVVLLSCVLADDQAQSQDQTAGSESDEYYEDSSEEQVAGTGSETRVISSASSGGQADGDYKDGDVVVTYITSKPIYYDMSDEDGYDYYGIYDDSYEDLLGVSSDEDVRNIETIFGVFADLLKKELGDPDEFEEGDWSSADADAVKTGSDEWDWGDWKWDDDESWESVESKEGDSQSPPATN